MEGRQLLVALLVAKEVVDSRKKIQVFYASWMYDHMNWEFLDFVMLKIGFGEKRR